MFRAMNWAAAVLAVGLMSLFTSTVARGQDAPATQPSQAVTGSIAVTVMDSDGKPASGVTLKLLARKPRKAPVEQAKKDKSLASGTTDGDGKFTFTNVALGSYRITGVLEGVAHGNARASVTQDSPNVSASITLKPYATPPADGGEKPTGPTTAPSAGV